MIVSDRRLTANRNNALLSTGPRTALGKRASRNNAFRHGLARPVSIDLAAAETAARLTAILSRSSNEPRRSELARHLAECFVDLERIRGVRSQILMQLGNLEDASLEDHQRAAEQLDRIWRYERRARSAYWNALLNYSRCSPAD